MSDQMGIPERARMVTLTAADGAPLDGLLYEPTTEAPGTPCLLHFHGKGGNFYSGPTRTVPAAFPDPSVAHLAINTRAHDLGYTRMDVPSKGNRSGTPHRVGGGMWERLPHGPEDIGVAAAFMRARGYERLVLVGHSHSGLHVAAYAVTDRDLAGRVLLSPLMDPSSALSLWFEEPGLLQQAIDWAERAVERDQGHHLLSVDRWHFAISAESLLDRVHAADDWGDCIDAVESPLLMLWGAAEARHAAWRSAFDGLRLARKHAVVVPEADHYYLGHEREVSNYVAAFVRGL